MAVRPTHTTRGPNGHAEPTHTNNSFSFNYFSFIFLTSVIKMSPWVVNDPVSVSIFNIFVDGVAVGD